MKKIINYSELGLILDVNLSGGRCACKKTALDNGGKNIYGTNAQFPLNRLITNAEKEIVNYTITFNKRVNGVDSWIQNKTVAAGSAIGSVTLPTVQGYHFDHWDPSDPTSVIATLNATYTAVYAQDTPQYTIEFRVPNDSKYGSYANYLIDSQQLNSGDAIDSTTPKTLAPVITNGGFTYHFVDWKDRVPKKATKNATYYAVYSEDDIPGSSLRYFTTVAEGNGSITFHVSDAVYSVHPEWGVVNEVSYRVWDGSESPDGQRIYSEWTTVSNPKGQDITVSDLQNGYEVEWKGKASGYAIGYYDNTAWQSGYKYQYSYFSSTCNMSIKNNLLTLLYNADADTISDIDDLWHLDSNSSYCFCGLFAGCTTLTRAEDLYFPTYLDSGEHHFCDLFRDCTNLTTASFKCGKRESTMLDSCYERMFLGCSSLTVPPELPAINLGYDCYQVMFSGCTSLVNAPILPATTLATGCYNQMFGSYEYYTGNYPGCTSLTRILMDAPYTHDWDGVVQHPLRNWADGITQAGTFIGDNDWIDDSTIPGNLPASWKQ